MMDRAPKTGGQFPKPINLAFEHHSRGFCLGRDFRPGSNCEELTQGAHFRVAPNNRHGAAERERPSPS
jgi:hypothetical protein